MTAKPKWFIGLILTMAICSSQASGEMINVLVFTDNQLNYEDIKLNAAPGITAVETKNINDITPANLANYDVLYAGSCFGTLLDSKATIIQDYIYSGHGVVVGQANTRGPIDWLPSSLSVDVANNGYFFGDYSLNTAGQSHPIFQDLEISELGDQVLDIIYPSGLGSDWTILADFTTDNTSTQVGMAVGTYGNGRVLLWPSRYESNGFTNPTSLMISQAYQWVAAPEPAFFTLLGTGMICLFAFALQRKKRK